MAAGDVYRVALVSRVHGHLQVNTFHYAVNQMPTTGTVEEAMIGPIRTGILDAIENVQSNAVVYQRVEIQKIFPGSLLARVDFLETSSGTIASEPVPDTVALVVRRTTLLAGRANRGRIFIGGVASSLYTAGTGFFDIGVGLSGPLVNAIKGPLANSALNFSMSPVIFSRTTHLFHPITGGFVDRTPRSQRRRELGVGV